MLFANVTSANMGSFQRTPWLPTFPSGVDYTTAPSNSLPQIQSQVDNATGSFTIPTGLYTDTVCNNHTDDFTLDFGYSQFTNIAGRNGNLAWATEGKFLAKNFACWNNSGTGGSADAPIRDRYPSIFHATCDSTLGDNVLTNVSQDFTSSDIVGWAVYLNDHSDNPLPATAKIITAVTSTTITLSANVSASEAGTGIFFDAVPSDWNADVTIDGYYAYKVVQGALIGPSVIFGVGWPSAKFTLKNFVIDTPYGASFGGGQEHALYLGRYGTLTIQNGLVKFSDPNLVAELGDGYKMRGKVNNILNCQYDAGTPVDGIYPNVGSLIEFPNCGYVNIQGGWYREGQGQVDNNKSMIRYGGEAQNGGWDWKDNGGTNELHIHGGVFDMSGLSTAQSWKFFQFYVTPDVIDVTGNWFLNVPNATGWGGSISDSYLLANNHIQFV